jgi:hypothetical protein
LVHDHFCLVIYNRWWEHSQKCWVGFGYHLVLGPLFWEGPHPQGFIVHIMISKSVEPINNCIWLTQITLISQKGQSSK